MKKGYWNFGNRYSSDAAAFWTLLVDRSEEYRVNACREGCEKYEFKCHPGYTYTHTCTFADGSKIIINVDRGLRFHIENN
jgi:hypothetical protein